MEAQISILGVSVILYRKFTYSHKGRYRVGTYKVKIESVNYTFSRATIAQFTIGTYKL